MPGYFAFGDVTLCPGSFVEAFGLAPVESVVAGTLAVCARVGALREMEGQRGLSHFAHGDVTAAAAAIEELLSRPPDMRKAAREMAARYSHAEMVRAYVEVIGGELPGEGGPAVPGDDPATGSGQGSAWHLAPWCYADGTRIYHDYLYGFREFPLLGAALGAGNGLFSAPDSGSDASVADEFAEAVRDGFLIPARGDWRE
jgi:hypothetical protein